MALFALIGMCTSCCDGIPQYLQVVLEGGWRNKLARPVMAALGIPVIPIWNQTVPLHGCGPG